jgi:hypothetical protein
MKNWDAEQVRVTSGREKKDSERPKFISSNIYCLLHFTTEDCRKFSASPAGLDIVLGTILTEDDRTSLPTFDVREGNV